MNFLKLKVPVGILIASLSLTPVIVGTVSAASINQVAYSSLSGIGFIDFESLAGGSAPGSNFDGIIDENGANFGERFMGQTLSFSGNSDILSGSPVGSLTLMAGLAGQNLNVFTRHPDGNVLAGLGKLGFPNFNAIGEGSVAILFDNDQSEFGFQSVGGNAGGAVFNFFRRDGSLIDTMTPMNLGVDFFGFLREGGVQDIAGISIYNTDPAGIGFDDIIFDVPGDPNPVVPEPATFLLFGTGLLGIVAWRRLKNFTI